MINEIDGLTVTIEAKANISNKSDIEIIGDNHNLILRKGARTGKIKIVMRGSNNTIEFCENVKIKSGLYVVKGENQHIKIGKNTTIEKAYLLSQENANIDIGEDCMFSYGITVRTTDAHSIFSKKTLKRINHSDSIHIGNKVWVGAEVVILKGVRVNDGNILGLRSLITKDIDLTNSIYAGSPAKLIKEDILWDRDLKEDFNDTTNIQNYRLTTD